MVQIFFRKYFIYYSQRAREWPESKNLIFSFIHIHLYPAIKNIVISIKSKFWDFRIILLIYIFYWRFDQNMEKYQVREKSNQYRLHKYKYNINFYIVNYAYS